MELESPPMHVREDMRDVDNEEDVEKEVPIETPSARVHIEKTHEV